MTKKQKENLLKAAKKLKGRRSVRYVGEKEIKTMADLDKKRSLAGETIRVYSQDGFVPNSYWGGIIDVIERNFSDGKKIFSITQTYACRSYGRGALVTINGHAYNS